MFGDIGHGFCLILASIMIHKYLQQTSSLYNIRYILLSLGLFSLYTGLIYSDFIGVPVKYQ